MTEQMKQLVEQLFANSYCLTFNPMSIKQVWQREHTKIRQFRQDNPNKSYIIVNEKSPIVLDYPDFHFFSDGTLVHYMAPSVPYKDEKIKNIKRALEHQGLHIKNIIEPKTDELRMEYFELVYRITRYAEEKYADFSSLRIKSLPDKESFVQSCFADGNILLNTYKEERIHPNFWDVTAIFADGRFIIPDKYKEKADFYGTYLCERFKALYREKRVLLTPQFVPQDYFNALYEKAKEYDWYISAEEMEKKFPARSNEDLQEMNLYIDRLLSNRRCISIVPNNGLSFPLPINARYVLFDDGKLVCSKSVSGVKKQDGSLFFELKKSFPKMEFNVEIVPDYYISEIYKRLETMGFSARKAYSDILNKKAEELSIKSHISPEVAFECVLNAEGWQNKSEFENELTEAHARHLIMRILRKEELSH